MFVLNNFWMKFSNFVHCAFLRSKYYVEATRQEKKNKGGSQKFHWNEKAQLFAENNSVDSTTQSTKVGVQDVKSL